MARKNGSVCLGWEQAEEESMKTKFFKKPYNHCKPARMAKVKRTTSVLVRTGRNWTPHHCGWKHKMVPPLWTTAWELNRELPYNPAVPLLGVSQEK